LIMRGFEYLETYKKTFNAGTMDEYVRTKTEEQKQEPGENGTGETARPPVQEEEKTPLTEKIKAMLSKMFEVEDQSIN